RPVIRLCEEVLARSVPLKDGPRGRRIPRPAWRAPSRPQANSVGSGANWGDGVHAAHDRGSQFAGQSERPFEHGVIDPHPRRDERLEYRPDPRDLPVSLGQHDYPERSPDADPEGDRAVARDALATQRMTTLDFGFQF